MSGLQWTGERFLPDVEGDVHIEHMHRYFLASRLAEGKRVLDIACGEGYGANVLADTAYSVIGIDISEEAVLHARKTYSKKNLGFVQGDCAAVPLKDDSVDLVVSFETIEHHDRHLEFILEIKRVLTKDGLLIISSPDKKEYSDLTGHDNQFHVKELYYPEFEALIKENFTHYTMLGQRIKYGSYITPINSADKPGYIGFKKTGSSVPGQKPSLFDPLYFISIAGDTVIPQTVLSLYEQPLEECETVTALSRSLEKKTGQYERLADEHDAVRVQRDLLEIEVARKKAQVDDMLNSTSWYVTRPLRWMSRKMRRLKPQENQPVFLWFQNMSTFIRTFDGMKNLLVRIRNLYRSRSIGGVKNKTRYLLSKIQGRDHEFHARTSAPSGEPTPYFEYCFLLNHDKRYYVPYRSCPRIDTGIKLIAFYLPQYHPIRENDQAWGRGFTEWTNVTRAIPQFEGHYQPRLPGELGFYDLRLEEIQKKQIALAKNYGIHGFCYHYYWFDGKKVLDTPLCRVLSNPDLDFPFCINWANENWTKRWDGLDNEVILRQNHSREDDMAFIKDIAPVLQDKRYIRVDGRPLLMIYRPQLFPEIKKTVKRWREYFRHCGIGEIYLVLSHAHEHTDPESIGFDAATEFAPNTFQVTDISRQLTFFNSSYQGRVFDYNNAIDYSITREEPDYVKFRSICPGWDNEARKPGKGITFHNASPERYATWLEYLLYDTQKRKKGDEKIIFINAWNEWAEGAYLEPDAKYGYAYLDETYSTLKKFDKEKIDLIRKCGKIQKTAEVAVVIHLFYMELWDEIKKHLASFKDIPFDLYVNINNECTVEHINDILEGYPDARIFSFENRGRDILPFLKIFDLVFPLNYKYICKIHSKKSLHRQDGDKWRQSLIKGLIGSPETIKGNIHKLGSDDRVGIIVPKGNVFAYRDWMGSNNDMVETFAIKNRIKPIADFTFPSGSMFWFKPVVFKQLYRNIDYNLFRTENGQLDGTMAHSVERIFGLICHANGYDLIEYP